MMIAQNTVRVARVSFQRCQSIRPAAPHSVTAVRIGRRAIAAGATAKFTILKGKTRKAKGRVMINNECMFAGKHALSCTWVVDNYSTNIFYSIALDVIFRRAPGRVVFNEYSSKNEQKQWIKSYY